MPPQFYNLYLHDCIPTFLILYCFDFRGFPVLDLYLAQLAEEQQKKIGAVERVEEQCLPLNGLTYGQVIFALNQTLQQHEDIRHGIVKPSYTTDDLIDNYQCGNINSVVFNQDTAQVEMEWRFVGIM